MYKVYLIPVPPVAMHISTATSPALVGPEEAVSLQKRPSNVLWYIFLVALLSILLLAQPDQRQSTVKKPTALVTGSTVARTDKPAAVASKESI